MQLNLGLLARLIPGRLKRLNRLLKFSRPFARDSQVRPPGANSRDCARRGLLTPRPPPDSLVPPFAVRGRLLLQSYPVLPAAGPPIPGAGPAVSLHPHTVRELANRRHRMP